MNNKSHFLRAVAVIGILTLITLTVLPGCNLVGKADPNNSANGSVQNSDVNTNGNQIVCPICSGTDVTGPDADGQYICNACGAKWSYNDDKIDVVDKDGNHTIYDSGNDIGVGGGTGGNHSGGTQNAPAPESPHFGGEPEKAEPGTTKPPKEILDELKQDVVNISKSVHIKYDPEKGEYYIESTNGKDTGLFGFKYSDRDKIFFTAEDAWQRNFGFSELYDKTSAPTAMSYDTVRVHFNYKNDEWMVQFWKGQYGLVMIGSEIGLYNRPAGSSESTHYNCVSDEEKLVMSMDVYRRESSTSNKFKHLFTRSPAKTWWCTGFTPGTLQAGTYNVSSEKLRDLKVDTMIQFQTPEQAQAFLGGLRKVDHITSNAGSNTKRSFKPKEYSAEEYASVNVNGKFALMPDGVTVRFCWR